MEVGRQAGTAADSKQGLGSRPGNGRSVVEVLVAARCAPPSIRPRIGLAVVRGSRMVGLGEGVQT